MRTVRWIVPALGVLALAACSGARSDVEFTPLGNGKDMANFRLVGIPASAVKVDGDVITLSGKPGGYFATKKSYKNYVLRFDWRYTHPAELKSDADTRASCLLHITG